MEQLITEVLTFLLDDECYGISVHQIREVLELIPITKIPKMPGFMKGVINIRGQVVPVIDLRTKFELQEIKDNLDKSIIIIEIIHKKIESTIGIIVDSVNAVINIDEKDIAPVPKIGVQVNTDFIIGMGKENGKFVTILDINKILTNTELSSLSEDLLEKV